MYNIENIVSQQGAPLRPVGLLAQYRTMKKALIIAGALALGLTATAQTVQLKNFNDSASYAIGQDMYNNWNQARLGINGEAAAQGMLDAARGQYKLSPEQTQQLLAQFQRNFENRGKEQMGSTIKAGKDFMTQNANNKSVRTTPSGLQYQRLQAGTGEKPKPGDHVTVHYTGTLIDGTKFDSSVDRKQPFEFDLGRGMVIPGWDEGIQLMEKGSKYRLVIPYNLAYGEREIGAIPAGSTLIFDVELIDFTTPGK